MRLPDYLRLQVSVLPQVLAINAIKEVVTKEPTVVRASVCYTI